MARGRGRREARQLAKEEPLRRIAAGTAVLPPVTVLPLEAPSTVAPAPMAPIAPAPVEEIVSLASSFDNEVDPFKVEQEPVPVPAPAPAPAFVIGGPVNLNADGIDLNARVATNKYGGALKYSQLSDSDKAIVDARRATGQDAAPDAYQGATALMSAVDYGSGTQYDTTEEALNGLSEFLGSISDKRKATDEEFNTRNYDPSEFAMAGVSPKSGVSLRAATDAAASYINNNNIPLSIEVNGQTRYLTTGLGSDVYRKADEDFDYKAGSYEDQGPVGTYNTVHVGPDNVFDSPLLTVVGMVVPQVALMTTALKVAAGEKITPLEIVGAGMAGLEYAGTIKAPTGAAAGGVGPVDTQGVGLLGTTYKETETLMKAAAADNLEGGVVQVFAPQVIDSVLSEVPFIELPETGLPEDFEAGLVKTVEKLAGGSNFDDALKAGGIEFIKEGGLKPLESIVKDAVKPIGDILDPIADALKAVTEPTKEFLSKADTLVRQELSEFDKEVLQPITKPVGDVLSDVDTTVRQELSEFDKEVLQPITKPVGDVIEDVAQVTGDVVEDVAQVTGDVVEDVGQAVGDVAEDLAQAASELVPDIDLPDVNLPDIDWKDLFKMFAGGMLSGAATQVVPSPTRTTDDLFGFETEVGLGDIELAQLQRRYLG
jgi:hypothetical protein